ncbi:hypothetical protein HYH02_008948 [Chlamydomonas schloesseri]|uniref:Copper transport protein n=1 Tax=Chlamydomonas schloesseri TaxID=2026947 RepID=A0A835WD32_9CHLO|nr:hypothetical protein HYH02_008948 [Chlamydomonas schloesseri]|eukprot:KAG2445081.1 hypothetical protein HYH02_008948 [Chlamydomonas schloesseri]
MGPLSLAANLVMLALVAMLLVFTPMFRAGSPHEPHSAMAAGAAHAGHDHAGHSHAAQSGTSSSDPAAAMSGHAHGSAMPMVMVFEYGYRVSFWFAGLSTDTIASYLAVLAGLAMLAAVHEGLAVYRRARVGLNNAGIGEDAEALRHGHGQKPLPGGAAASASSSASSERLVQAALHVLSLGLAYGLMLAVMSMNAGVFVAVLLGFGLGHWAFATDRGLMGAAPALVRGEACHGS